MLLELGPNSRACVAPLFSGYPYLHGSIAALIEGGVGKVFADSAATPQVALGVLDFHFLAGDPDHSHTALLPWLQPGMIMIAPTPVWQRGLAAGYPGELAPYPPRGVQGRGA